MTSQQVLWWKANQHRTKLSRNMCDAIFNCVSHARAPATAAAAAAPAAARHI